MDISHLRREYLSGGLDLDNLSTDPLVQFELWFNQATKAEVPDLNAMTLGTVTQDGNPFQRVVLLKSFDDNGFIFFTNYDSDKGRQITNNNHVCCHFSWLPLNRQIIISGSADKISTEESEHYFLSRPLESQIAAWASHQSQPLSSRKILDDNYDQWEQKFSTETISLPPNWGGYRVTPNAFEFWQGRESRLHDRFRYQLKDNKWEIERLAP